MTARSFTAKGEATRRRIVEATADQVLASGVGGTSLDEIRGATSTSKSQLFHYFPGGKHELLRAVVALQGERVAEAQRPAIDELHSWDAWDRWRDSVLAHYGAQHGWGCPIGSLAAESAGNDPELAAQTRAYLRTWSATLATGVRAMQAARLIRDGADADRLGTATLAAVQGGLLLTQVEQALWPLEMALDAAVANLRSWSV